MDKLGFSKFDLVGDTIAAVPGFLLLALRSIIRRR